MEEEWIVAAIRNLVPWRAEQYNPDAWSAIIRLAGKLQRCNPTETAASIERFIMETTWDDDSDLQWSKVFLLLRVLFELPELADPNEAASFGGWMVPWRGRPAPATVDLGWPVRWEDDAPRLVASFGGYKGPPYRAADEYRWYLERYPFRDLRGQGDDA